MAGVSYCPECGSKEHDESILDEGIVCEACGAVCNRDDRLSTQPQSARKTESTPEITFDEVTRVTNGTQANVAEGIEYLHKLCDHLELTSSSRTRAAEIFAQVMKRNISDGRPLEELVTSVVYLSCRLEGEPRPVTDIAQDTSYESNEVVSGTKKIRNEIDVEQPIVEPEAYLEWISKSLGLGESVVSKAVQVLRADTKCNPGTNPAATAAASLYLVAESQITQHDAAVAAGVTTETIRVRLKNLREISNV